MSAVAPLRVPSRSSLQKVKPLVLIAPSSSKSSGRPKYGLDPSAQVASDHTRHRIQSQCDVFLITVGGKDHSGLGKAIWKEMNIDFAIPKFVFKAAQADTIKANAFIEFDGLSIPRIPTGLAFGEPLEVVRVLGI